MTADRLNRAIVNLQLAEENLGRRRREFHRAVQAYLTEQTLLRGSTKRLARRLDTSIAVVSNYKNGYGRMSVEWARLAMKVLGDL